MDGVNPPPHAYAALDNYVVSLTLSWNGGAPVQWRRPILAGVQGAVAYVDVERGRDADGFGGSWQTPFQSLSHAVAAAAVVKGVDQIWVRAGVYVGTEDAVVKPRRGLQLYGGFSGSESSLVERNLASGYESIIDGEYLRACVIGANNAALDGFTLRRGADSIESGVYCDNTALELRNCRIVDNVFCGVYCDGAGAVPRLINCVIAGNGTGVYAASESAPELHFCTLAANENGGVYSNNALPKLAGCIVWDNANGGMNADEGSAPEVYYTLIQGGHDGVGNVDADPLFTDGAARDYRLLPGSPALDAGWAPIVPQTDIVGRPRPWGSGPDMGAYEYQGGGETEVEELPLGTDVERTLVHGQSLAFLARPDEEAPGDLVALLTPLSNDGQWRLNDEDGTQGFAVAGGLMTITPRSEVYDNVRRYVVSYLNFAAPAARGTFRFRVDLKQRFVAPLPAPITLSNGGGPVTVSINGVGFIPGMTTSLRDAAGAALASFPATSVNANLLRIVLEGTGLPSGSADLAVLWPDTESMLLSNAATIVAEGVGPVLEARLEAPPAMRPNRSYTLWLHYANTGDADMKAPLFIVSCPDVLFRLEAESPWRSESIQILGLNDHAPVETLPPGTRRSVPILIYTTAWVGEQLDFTLRQMPHNDAAVNWEDYRDLLRPRGTTPEAWSELWPTLREYLGGNWGDYLDALYLEAVRCEALGMPANGVDRLIPLAIRRALGLPVARISGRVLNRASGGPLANVVVKAQRADDASFHLTAADADGRFCFNEVEDGEFGLYVEQWLIDPETSVEVKDQQDVLQVSLDAYPMVDPIPPPEFPTDRRAPILTADAEGRLWMLWTHGNHVRWALWETDAWTACGPALDGGASIKALGSAPNLFGAEEGLFAVWEHLRASFDEEGETEPDSGMEIRGATARIGEEGLTWSEPCLLSGTSYENTAPAAVWLDGELLAVWQQHNADLAGSMDDTDLYYALADGTCFVFAEADPPKMDEHSDKAQHCVDLRLRQGTSLPKSIPVIGGKYEFDLRFNACGEESCAGRQVSGGIALNIKFSEILSGVVGGNGAAKWVVVCEPSPDWTFNEASVTASGGVRGTFEMPFPVVAAGVPVGTVYVGGFLQAGISGTLLWKSNFPGWPSGGYIDGSGGGGGSVRAAALDFMGLLDEGLVGAKGELGVDFRLRWIPLTSLTYRGYCVTLVGEVSALNGMVKYSISGTWGPACGKGLYPLLPPGGPYVVKNGAAQDWIWVGDEQNEHALTVSVETSSGSGTGGVLEGLPVLANVAEDLYGDGAPALTSDGERMLLLWTKDSATPETQLGSRVAWALRDKDVWTAPNYIEEAYAVNGKPVAAFLPDGWALALWSQASASGLNGASAIEDVLAAAEDTRLMYAFFDGSGWTVPVMIPGADQAHLTRPALAVDDEGHAVAAWLAGAGLDGRELWSAYWDGDVWSAPELIGEGAHADAPAVAATETGFMIACAVARNDEVLLEPVWRLYETRRLDGAWSPLTPMPDFLFEPFEDETETGDLPEGAAVMTALPWDKGLPEDCCEGEGEGEGEEEGEDPEPPEPPLEPGPGDGGSVIGAIDPNEKISTTGLGDAETQRYVFAGDTIEYMIFFENLPTAVAPAQEVFVVDQLPTTLDWGSLQLHEIAWGDVVHSVNMTGYEYAAAVLVPDHRPGVDKIWRVDLEFVMDVVSGECRWTFRTIDPDTNELPEDPWAGFLPPNDPESGIGEGRIVFSVKTKANLPDAARIENLASIVFDSNEPIVTNAAFNIAANPPQAAFTASHSGGPAPLTVSFTNHSVLTPGSLTGYLWDFGDGASSAAANPTHRYEAKGDYTVWLTVSTPLGEDRTSARILVTQAAPPSEGEGEGETLQEGEGESTSAKATVPKVIGLTREAATAALESLGFKVVVRESGRKAPKNQVTDQNPSSGTEVEAGSTVTITVSKGGGVSVFGCGPNSAAEQGGVGDWSLLLATLALLVFSGVGQNLRIRPTASAKKG